MGLFDASETGAPCLLLRPVEELSHHKVTSYVHLGGIRTVKPNFNAYCIYLA